MQKPPHLIAFWFFLFFGLGTVSVGATALSDGILGGFAFIGLGFIELVLAGRLVRQRE